MLKYIACTWPLHLWNKYRNIQRNIQENTERLNDNAELTGSMVRHSLMNAVTVLLKLDGRSGGVVALAM